MLKARGSWQELHLRCRKVGGRSVSRLYGSVPSGSTASCRARVPRCKPNACVRASERRPAFGPVKLAQKEWAGALGSRWKYGKGPFANRECSPRSAADVASPPLDGRRGPQSTHPAPAERASLSRKIMMGRQATDTSRGPSMSLAQISAAWLLKAGSKRPFSGMRS